MDNKEVEEKTNISKNDKESEEEDEQMISYYEALLQSIRDGIEDIDLVNREDVEAAFSEDDEESE
jgi:hypothetical protein